MKKLLTIAMALCSAHMAMASSSNAPEESNMPESTTQNGEGTDKGKMLVVYFSRAGENWEDRLAHRRRRDCQHPHG